MRTERPEYRAAERIIGLDLSKKTFQGCILERKEGFRKHHAISGGMDPDGRMKLIGMLNADDWVIIEGGTSSSVLARQIMALSEASVFMLNPQKLHIIFQTAVKTDRKDAVKIAEYIRDTDPEKWPLISIPTEDESGERMLINQWIFSKEERTKHVNRLHAVFNQCGMPGLSKSDLKDAGKRRSLIDHFLSSNEHAHLIASMLDDAICMIELQLDEIEARIREMIMMRHPEEALSWLSLPGVGIMTAASCIAYAGDMERFDGPKQLRNYVGLLPRISQSGERCSIYGVNFFGCKPIRRHIMQAAWTVSMNRTPNTLTRAWNSYAERGKKGQRAAVAIANKLLTIGYFLVRNKSLYNGFGNYEYLEQKLKREKITALRTCMYQMQKRTERLA